jgi:hypothetical protein
MKKRKPHSAEQIFKKLRDAYAMLAAGYTAGKVFQSLEVSEAALSRSLLPDIWLAANPNCRWEIAEQ